MKFTCHQREGSGKVLDEQRDSHKAFPHVLNKTGSRRPGQQSSRAGGRPRLGAGAGWLHQRLPTEGGEGLVLHPDYRGAHTNLHTENCTPKEKNSQCYHMVI